MKRIVIGTTGELGAGKSIIREELESRGYVTFSLGDITRREAYKRGLLPKRAVLQDIGNEFREKNGSDYLARRAANLFNNNPRILVDGIRNPGEIEYLKNNFGMVLIGVSADPSLRKAFAKARNREGDPLDDAGFQNAEKRDRGVGEPSYGQQVDLCLQLADFVIANSGTEDDLRKKFLETLSSFGIEGASFNPESK